MRGVRKGRSLRAMTLLMLFVIGFLKAVILGTAYKLGWVRSPEQVGKDRLQEKQVLMAYREWRSSAGPDRAAEVSVALKTRSETNKRLRAVEKHFGRKRLGWFGTARR